MATPKSLAFKATLLLDPEYEHLRKSCSETSRGYACLFNTVTKKMSRLHRHIYELKNGPIPEGLQIDHCDRNKVNNQLSNLRLADSFQNQCNRPLRKDSATKITGLTIYTCRNGKQVFLAQVNFKHKPHCKYFELGQKQEAIAWLKETRAQLHGDFANNG